MFGAVKFFFQGLTPEREHFAVVEVFKKVKEDGYSIYCQKAILFEQKLILIKDIIGQYLLIETDKYFKLQCLTKLK